MGSSSNLYLGAYVKIPNQIKKVVTILRKCSKSNCSNKKFTAADMFCSLCGSPIVATEKIETKPWYANQFWYDLAEKHGLDYDAFATFDPENYAKASFSVYYPNISTEHSEQLSIKIAGDGIYALPSQAEIEQAKQFLEGDFKKEIDILRQEVGAENVQLEYGLLSYTH